MLRSRVWQETFIRDKIPITKIYVITRPKWVDGLSTYTCIRLLLEGEGAADNIEYVENSINPMDSEQTSRHFPDDITIFLKNTFFYSNFNKVSSYGSNWH